MGLISDIDGTLIIKGVQPNKPVIDLVNGDPTVIIITGRAENTRAQTELLLQKYNIKYAKLMMNTMGPDKQVESKLMNAKSALSTYKITEAIDNDPAVRQGYEQLGIRAVAP